MFDVFDKSKFCFIRLACQFHGQKAFICLLCFVICLLTLTVGELCLPG